MQDNKTINYIKSVVNNMPSNWLNLTTHRLDIYNEELAKTQFLEHFEKLYEANNSDQSALDLLPTAYDYIRLGHPLSCVLEWSIAKLNNLDASNVISFSSKTTPILAVLRKNLIDHKNTRILYTDSFPQSFSSEMIKTVYGYTFETQKIEDLNSISPFDGSTILVVSNSEIGELTMHKNIDFYLNLYQELGSILVVNGTENEEYISEIQHVRRRETVAMTPANTLNALQILTDNVNISEKSKVNLNDKASVLEEIKSITGTNLKPVVGSSGLSIQYAIMMGLVDNALENHKGKAIKFIVPPNCYGGTNDQARRVAACLDFVEVVDLPVDGDNDMVKSIDTVLNKIAKQDAVPYIIAEIPTNPRVEVPELLALKEVLSKERKTENGSIAVDPVFILDQTFCPNVLFLGEGKILSTVRTISYASGSKFPSGGKCTAGYCVGNDKTEKLIDKIHTHLELCDNEATAHQYEILAKQLPSMNQRIADAYTNTREFVNFIQEVLPEAKINFVSEALAKEGFTPSVFSLDLPTKGNSDEEREAYKRALNLKLINLMITEIPDESKYCVSYGQLKGCYWTIPATSTQGTTKEGDKDYIARVALSANLNLELHKKVFQKFVDSI
ncbi:cystathionine beta-synthase [Polaribacter sp. BM10]|uniref:cystathionine beta-synthase n=1 Tax=Polaribacter sp. BM10 TaxID=1529069 RepID=UPI00098B955D|nr:cystathionine beta-synthase [Polaribacter sp. BM10]AQS93404.1 cystathionine beta-synthase [Polaribacter sp. BM10]